MRAHFRISSNFCETFPASFQEHLFNGTHQNGTQDFNRRISSSGTRPSLQRDISIQLSILPVSSSPHTNCRQSHKWKKKEDLVHRAFVYLTEKTYPPGSTKNEKRCIRKKADRFVVTDGVMHYQKKDGVEVCL